ncbi:hypothetical protein IEQ34_001369 [Dendrobium chrysotoxum]|uniref:Uncharacterized protein n=1 Tax=Dendrobium chrysotoxum TaxID=161865 RepID=A0AAV7FLA6_DENCH|nr:hypothetical protein IEQ34_026775 [Dendrobium chrysotoxum]KAH0469811.1 hypothetical protein IEQ34_001369 [Dendrobium chrysotoxum]
MGNCSLRPPVTWVDDELADDLDDEPDDELEDGKKGEKSTTRPRARIAASTTKVRIKINKKQLEDLLSRAQAKSLSILDLMSIGQVSFDEIQMHYWRPALQSISEEYDQ